MTEKGNIGIIDSGYGGITILNEIVSILPEYSYVYLGDNARAPYGVKSYEVVLEHTWECVEYLLNKKNCDLIILACNTASAKALRTIQQKRLIDYPGKRVLGVIRPSAEIIGKLTTKNEIGVLATDGTVNSLSYKMEVAKFFPNITVNQQSCPLWVPLIENAEFSTSEGENFINKDLNLFKKNFPSTDTVILGCTHYPILLNILKKLAPEFNFISQGEIVANALNDYLKRHEWLVRKLSTKRNVEFLTTESAECFDRNVKSMFGLTISSKKINL